MRQFAGHDAPLVGVHVLVVEDYAMVREVISQLLVEFGATVTATAGVAEALDAFARERPDVVLSDIEMADEDGYALIRKLRALPQDRGGLTPAAGLTGLSTAEDQARVLQAGFQYYLAKPVDAKTLVNVVATLATRSVAVLASTTTGTVPESKSGERMRAPRMPPRVDGGGDGPHQHLTGGR